MTSIVQQGSSLGLGTTFPSLSPHNNRPFGSFDLVSSPVWWEAETNIETSFQQSGAYAQRSWRRWAGTHFDRYMDLVGCVLVLMAVDRWGALACMLESQRAVPKALTLPERGRVIAWRLSHFLRGMSMATLVRLVGRTRKSDFLQAVKPDSFGQTLLSAVLTLSLFFFNFFFYIYMFCLFNKHVPSTFSSSASSFRHLTGHNRERESWGRKEIWGVEKEQTKLIQTPNVAEKARRVWKSSWWESAREKKRKMKREIGKGERKIEGN